MKPGTRLERILLGQDRAEVQAAMSEEGCLQCFGCPNATILAAEIVRDANYSMNLAFRMGRSTCRVFGIVEDVVTDNRADLAELTANCSGYQHQPVKDSPTPSKMCSSPEIRHPRISIFAGRILDFFNR